MEMPTATHTAGPLARRRRQRRRVRRRRPPAAATKEERVAGDAGGAREEEERPPGSDRGIHRWRRRLRCECEAWSTIGGMPTSLTSCVVGATSYLATELIYQLIVEEGQTVQEAARCGDQVYRQPDRRAAELGARTTRGWRRCARCRTRTAGCHPLRPLDSCVDGVDVVYHTLASPRASARRRACGSCATSSTRSSARRPPASTLLRASCSRRAPMPSCAGPTTSRRASASTRTIGTCGRRPTARSPTRGATPRWPPNARRGGSRTSAT